MELNIDHVLIVDGVVYTNYSPDGYQDMMG